MVNQGMVSGLCHKLVYTGFVVLTALPDHFHVFPSGAAVLDPMLDAAVQGTAAKASADHEEMLLGGIQAEVLNCIGLHLGSGGGGEGLAYGISAHHYPFGREEAFHPLIGDADALDFLCQSAVGESREAVLLLDEAGYLHCSRGPQKGCAGIAAHAHDYVRFELFQDSAGFGHAFEYLEGQQEVLQGELALHSGYRQAHDPETFGRDFLHFHFSECSYEEDLGLPVALLEGVAYGYGGEDVASRAASAYYGSDGFVLHIKYLNLESNCPGGL